MNKKIKNFLLKKYKNIKNKKFNILNIIKKLFKRNNNVKKGF